MADIVYPGETPGETINAAAMPMNNNLVIYKGDYVEMFVTVKDNAGVPLVLTGTTPAAQLKKNYTDGAPINFTCTLTGVTGEVRIFLPSALSSSLVAGDYIWDFQITNGTGQTKTYLAGDVVVYNEVTT